MKKYTATLTACIAAVCLSSCGGVIEYINCMFNPDDCLLIEPAPRGVINLDDVDTPVEAEELADAMDTLLTFIENAKKLDIKVPDYAIEAYNLALEHLVKNNYFGSEQVREAISTAKPL